MSEAEKARTRRYWLAILAPGLLLGAVLLWRFYLPPVDVSADNQADVINVTEASSQHSALASTENPASPSAATHQITINGRLIADQQAQALADQAFIGLGYFDPEDLQEYRLIGDESPERLADLAVIDGWIETPLSFDDSGNASLQAADLPQADVYRLVAKGTGMGFYFAYQFGEQSSSILDFGEVFPESGAGLSIRFNGPENIEASSTTEFPVFFQRGQAGNQWRLARQLFNPEIEPMLFGDQRFGVGDSIALLPLTPNQFIQVSVEGKAGQRMVETTGPLPTGQQTEIILDLSSLIIEQALLVDLIATIQDESGESISGVQIVDHPDQQTVCPASDLLGRCTVLDISPEQTSYFVLLTDAQQAADLAIPARYSVQFDPTDTDLDTMLETGRAQVSWVVPNFRRLILDHSIVPIAVDPPFPIFAIQQQNAEGQWVTINAEQFNPRSSTEMVITIKEDGIYRGQAALSPWQVLETNAVTITASEGEQSAVLQPARIRAIELNINDAATGLPADQVFVTVASEFSDAPSSHLALPEPGRLALEVSGVERLSIEVHQAGLESQEFEISTDVSEPIELLINTNEQ